MDGLANLFKGFSIPFDSFGEIRRNSPLWRYIMIPLIINIIIFGAGFALLWIFRVDLIELIWAYPGDSWLLEILWYTLGVIVFALASLMAYFLFTPLGCLIASPFNDSLAGKSEQIFDPEIPQTEIPLSARAIFATIGRELVKVLAIGLVMGISFLLNLLPGIGSVFSIVFIAFFGSWVFSLEYLDYPMNRHGYKLSEILAIIRQNRGYCMGFGLGAMLLLMIPILNLLCIPVCVVGATKLFVELSKAGRIIPK